MKRGCCEATSFLYSLSSKKSENAYLIFKKAMRSEVHDSHTNNTNKKRVYEKNINEGI